ncbi:TRAP transporter small permease subunit [Chloroflexota bacterium]
MKKLGDFISKVSENIGKAVAVVLVLIVVVMVTEVAGRYLFNHPFAWTNEIVTYFFALLVLPAGAWALVDDSHIRVDVLYGLLSPRKKAIINAVMSPLFIIFAGGLLWSSSAAFGRSLETLELSGTMWNVPLYPVKMLVPIGAFLLLIQGLVKLGRDIAIIRGRLKPEEEFGEKEGI